MKQVCPIWYYHLPWVASDEEVKDLSRESIGPLLSVHHRLRVPLTLVITGTLLARMRRLVPKTIARMNEMESSGLMEIGATFYHEIFPHFLVFSEIETHIFEDVYLKEVLFARRPTMFYPSNFVWSPVMLPMLARAGIDRVVLDSQHLVTTAAVQQWEWRDEGPTAPLVAPVTSPESTERLWAVNSRSGDGLLLAFRNREKVMNFSFGNVGGLQYPGDETALERASASFAPTHGLNVIADDGDRINPTSILQYRKVLERNLCRIVRLRDAKSERFGKLDFLPGFSIGDIHSFWLARAENTHWLRTLETLRCLAQPESLDDLLPLHDVYPFFYPTHWRTGLFWDSAYRLWERHRR